MKIETKQKSWKEATKSIDWIKGKLAELEDAKNQFLFVQNQYGNLEQSEGEWGASSMWEDAENDIETISKEIAAAITTPKK